MVAGYLASGCLRRVCSSSLGAAESPSTSGRCQPPRPCTPWAHSLKLAARQLQRCNVTNEGREMRVEELYEQIEGEWVEQSAYQVPNPELGPLERRVDLSYEDALFSPDISPEDAAYWFTCPEGGWNQTPIRMLKGEEVANEWPDARHFGRGRTGLSELTPGKEMTGTIIRCMLFHGVQVDLGAEYDGLVPVTEEQWGQLTLELTLDREVRVRVHKVHDTKLHRFPVQLELLDPDLSDKLSPPETHDPALDLRGQGDMQFLEQYTGKTYQPSKYWANFTPSDAQTRLEEFASETQSDDEFQLQTPARLRARISDFAASR